MQNISDFTAEGRSEYYLLKDVFILWNMNDKISEKYVSIDTSTLRIFNSWKVTDENHIDYLKGQKRAIFYICECFYFLDIQNSIIFPSIQKSQQYSRIFEWN